MARKASAVARTLGMFDAPSMAPQFGARPIPSAMPPITNMPLFAGGPKVSPVDVQKALDKITRRKQQATTKQPKRKHKKGPVKRNLVAQLIERNQKLEAELQKCKSVSDAPTKKRQAKKSSAPKKPRVRAPKLVESPTPVVSRFDSVVLMPKDAPKTTKRQLRQKSAKPRLRRGKVGRKLAQSIAKRSRVVQTSRPQRTSIVDSFAHNSLLDTSHLQLEPDYDDPAEYLLPPSERAEIAAQMEKGKARALQSEAKGLGVHLQGLAATNADALGDLRDEDVASIDDVSGRVKQLLREAESLERQSVDLVRGMVQGPGETEHLRKKKQALDAKAIELRTKAVRLDKYEKKKVARAARLRLAAADARSEAQTLNDVNRRLGESMAGTPIHVGHYSEARHRREFERIHDRTRKEFGLHDKAKKLEKKAKALESSHVIRSDDPDAVHKLQEKLAALEDEFPSLSGYRRTNARQEIVRVKSRIEQLQKNAKKAGKTETINGVIIEWNAEENRVQIRFPGKPNAEMRDFLKGRGFKWAPSQEAWQRIATDNAWWAATMLIKDYYKLEDMDHA